MPQQAVAKGIGQRDERRDQLTSFLSWVVRMLSGRSCVSIAGDSSEGGGDCHIMETRMAAAEAAPMRAYPGGLSFDHDDQQDDDDQQRHAVGDEGPEGGAGVLPE